MADYEAIQRRRNIIVGIFIIISVCIFFVMLFLFQDMPAAVTRIKSFEVVGYFPSAPGVNKDTPVQYCGYQIGRVVAIHPPRPMIDRHGITRHMVGVTMAIERKYNTIPSNSDFKLIKRGLGSSYVDIRTDPLRPLVPLDANNPMTKFLTHGAMVFGTTGTDNEFIPQETMDKVSTLISHINDIIGDPNNKHNLAELLGNVNKAAAEAELTLAELRKFSIAGAAAMETANVQMQQLGDSAARTSNELGTAVIELRRVLEKINYGNGTAAKLINDDRLYESLVSSTTELKAALEKFRAVMEKTEKKGVQVKLF